MQTNLFRFGAASLSMLYIFNGQSLLASPHTQCISLTYLGSSSKNITLITRIRKKHCFRSIKLKPSPMIPCQNPTKSIANSYPIHLNHLQSAYRKVLVSHAEGLVLETGVGTSRNLNYYPSGTEIIGVDWSPNVLEGSH